MAQHHRVDLDAGGFHIGEDADQRHLDPGVEIPQALFFQLFAEQRLDEAGGHAFASARLVVEVEEHHLPVGGGFRQVGAEVSGRLGFQFVAPLGIEQIVHDLDIVERALEGGMFQAEAAFDNLFVGQDGRRLRIGEAGVFVACGEHHPVGEPDGDAAVLARLGEQRFLWDRLAGEHVALDGGNGVDRRHQPAQGVEFIAVEQFGHADRIGLADGQQRFLDGDVDIGLDGDQELALVQVGQGLAERGLLLGGQFVEVRLDAFQRPVFRHQFAGAHFADAGDALHIVGRITPDGQDVDDLGGVVDAVMGADGGLVDDFLVSAALAGLVLENVVVDHLSQVLVGRDHIHVEAAAGKIAGYGADHVVGLEAGLHQHGDAEGVDDFGERFERGLHQFGRGGAGGFVFRVDFVPESPARRVEHHGQMRGLLAGDELEQILGEPEQDGRVLAFRVDHGPAQECVIHPENQRVAVDQV